MKKIYSLVASLALVGGVFAQSTLSDGQVGQAYKVKDVDFPAASVAAPFDTVGIDDFFNTVTGLSMFGNIGGGYIFGVNNLGITGLNPPGLTRFAQGYVSVDDYAIVEAIFYFGALDIQSGNPANVNLTASVWDLTGTAINDAADPSVTTAGPGTMLASKSFPLTDVDTNVVFSSVMFDNPVGISAGNDFAIGLDVTGLYASGDTVGLVTGGEDESVNSLYTFVFHTQLGGWLTIDAAYGLDVDVVMFGVSDQAFAGIGDADFYGGMQLGQNMPNPAIGGNTEILYALETQTEDVVLELIDGNGRLVKKFKEGNKEAGEHNLKLDGLNLTAGNYYYSLIVNGNRLTKKMTILK